MSPRYKWYYVLLGAILFGVASMLMTSPAAAQGCGFGYGGYWGHSYPGYYYGGGGYYPDYGYPYYRGYGYGGYYRGYGYGAYRGRFRSYYGGVWGYWGGGWGGCY